MKLIPFSTSAQALDIDARIEVQKHGFLLSFEIAGAGVDHVVLSTKNPKPSRKNELWKETCFECFFGVGNSKQYFEFNGSASGDWALYSFNDYRSGMKDVAFKDSVKDVPVLEKIEKTVGKILCVWRIPYFTDAIVQSAALTAILKTGTKAEDTGYFALKHSGEKPDFHVRENFIHRFI